jgi:hypothetical protein
MAEAIHRHLAVLPRGDRETYLSWRLLSTDSVDEPFQIERGQAGQWESISTSPIIESTDFKDKTPIPDIYDYRVFDGSGRISETVSVDSGKDPSNLAIEFPLRYKPEQFPTRMSTGDLLNNGQFGFVVVESDNGRIQVCAYAQNGVHLWHYDAGLPSNGAWDGRTWHVPVIILDVDRDGRTEVVFHRGPGAEFEDNKYAGAGPDETLICVDGETGDIKWEVPWLAVNPRVMMTPGSLNGEDAPLSVVILDGTYRDVRMISHGGSTGEVEWQVDQARGAGHNLDIDDIDGDGRMEVICGGVCYNYDGSVRWEAEPFGHTDVSKPAHFLPDREGKQILYLVEKEEAGAYLVDKDGKTIWKVLFGHAHWSWIGRYAGMGDQLMIHAAGKGRLLYFPIFSPEGKEWIRLTKRQAHRFAAVGWKADGTIAFARRDACHIVRINEDGEEVVIPGSDLPTGSNFGRVQLAMDIVGDFRENLGCIDYEYATFYVAQNPLPAGRRALSPTEDANYLHERAQVGSGYYTYIAPPMM